MVQVTYKMNVANVDWDELKHTLVSDQFDNGRTPAQYKASFEKSYVVCIAYVAGNIVGTARALSDGVCNAYIVDVWTLSAFRRRGIAKKMMEKIMAQLQGQHVYLFTDDMMAFYKTLGFEEQPVGMGRVVGEWLLKE
ncbi:MAG: GNAT family N-acetyltransferase [Ardenticatenaceae bacterium]|nr:GNAT family N-acetyltransferase [Ardenticatenaceae bacterium]